MSEVSLNGVPFPVVIQESSAKTALTCVVSEQDGGRRAGRLAAQRFGLSARDLTLLKQTDGLLLDGIPVHMDARVRPGQVLAVCLPDRAATAARCGGALHVVYENDGFLVVDKPAGMPTMRSSNQDGDSVQALFEASGGVFRPVNRLDKGTGGLMAVARSAYCQHRLSGQLHSDLFIREYLAVAEGSVSGDTGIIDLPIGRVDGSANLRQGRPGGKPSVTCCRVLYRANGRTLLRLRLLTGRTHQIRVHLSALGHPLTGDPLYGRPHPLLPGCFALHSAYLFLTDPLTGKRLSLYSPPPPVFGQLTDA